MASEDENVKETNSGVKKRGDWNEIAEFGEKVEEVVEDSADEDSVEKFSDWRPRKEESEEDVKEKTVDKAVLDEKKIEEESEGVKDLKQASSKVSEAGKKAATRQNPEKELKGAGKDAAKPFYSGFARIFRKLENLIYSKVVLKLNPYYLDTQDFSADVRRRSKGKFEMDVSAPKEDMRKDLKEGFENDS
jgi:hypothetical protein